MYLMFTKTTCPNVIIASLKFFAAAFVVVQPHTRSAYVHIPNLILYLRVALLV